MAPTVSEIEAARQAAGTVEDYLGSLSKLYRWKFMEYRESYRPDPEAIEALKAQAGDHFILAFSAQWCKDCSRHIPVLGLVSEATGIEVRVLGGIKTDPLRKDSLWAVPPSPPEVNTFGVRKLPWIVLFDKTHHEVGRIVETPEHTGSIEEEILYLIRAQG